MSDAQQGPGWWLASDGRWYPPNVQPPVWTPVLAPPAPPRSRSLLIVLTLLGGVLIAIAAVAVATAGAVRSHPAAKDVVLTSCTHDGTGFEHVGGTITNHSSKTSTYTLHVSVETADGTRVGEAVASQSDVRPGQAAQFSTLGTITGLGAKCRLTSVTRFASP